MSRAGSEAQLDIVSLLAHGSLRTTKPLYVTPVSAPVNAVAIVTKLDAIQRVAPDTVIVLSAEMGSRGWLVSAALRLAWERRASAVVVAGSTYSSAVTGLAERLGITLLAADQDPASVALDLAAALGVARSVVDAQLARFARAVAQESTAVCVLRAIFNEFDGSLIALEQDGVVLVSAGVAGDEGTRIAVDIRGVDDAVSARITARIPKSAPYSPDVVRSILEVAAPSVQAALLLEGIRGNASAVPTAALATLDLSEPGDIRDFETRYHHVLTHLGWRTQQSYTAVWILHDSAESHRADLTAVLRLLWRKVAVRRPLAEVPGGWLSLVPAEYQEDATQLETRITTRIGPALRELGLSVGLSCWQPEPPELVAIVQEARLAAESARVTGSGTVAVFGELDVAAASGFVDSAAILLVAKLTLPDLMKAADREQIILAVTAFLDHHSAMIPAARFLKVHRNTLQTRLNRARELRIPIDDPAKLLSTHLILSVLRKSVLGRSIPQTGPSSPTAPTNSPPEKRERNH